MTLTIVTVYVPQYMNIKDELTCVTNEVQNLNIEKDQRVSGENETKTELRVSICCAPEC